MECRSRWERRAAGDDLETASLTLLSMGTEREMSLIVSSGKGGRCEAEEGLPNREIEAWRPQRWQGMRWENSQLLPKARTGPGMDARGGLLAFVDPPWVSVCWWLGGSGPGCRSKAG